MNERLRFNGKSFTCAFVMFTQAVYTPNDRKYGEELADYIIQHDLGTVTRSLEKRNPNSGRKVTVYLWEIAPVKTKRWLKG
jgi:hypothetical protein